jgi:hypothetical protein
LITNANIISSLQKVSHEANQILVSLRTNPPPHKDAGYQQLIVTASKQGQFSPNFSGNNPGHAGHSLNHPHFSDDPLKRNGYLTDKAVALVALINHIRI